MDVFTRYFWIVSFERDRELFFLFSEQDKFFILLSHTDNFDDSFEDSFLTYPYLHINGLRSNSQTASETLYYMTAIDSVATVILKLQFV